MEKPNPLKTVIGAQRVIGIAGTGASGTAVSQAPAATGSSPTTGAAITTTAAAVDTTAGAVDTTAANVTPTTIEPTATIRASTNTTVPTTVPDQDCTEPGLQSSAPFGGSSYGNYYVFNDMWNETSPPSSGVGSQTIYACWYSNWYVVSDQAATTDVKSHPNVQDNFKSVPVTQFSTLTSSFAETDPHVGIYEDAYDMWLNGVANSTSNEVMIWNENHNQVPGGSP